MAWAAVLDRGAARSVTDYSPQLDALRRACTCLQSELSRSGGVAGCAVAGVEVGVECVESSSLSL